ncbi:unnamed protein product [Mytilus coruscus]|uniref:Endonuclease/exonuclease/phosphatase domain-containing protein n=1 Tax=Mytilus coruscus TaxID=42192 RepID=A0A6J8BGE9_MYTCO|nr:unnamed protein product [Mytilus coruscus]
MFEINTRTLLKELPHGLPYRLTANGRIIKKTTEPANENEQTDHIVSVCETHLSGTNELDLAEDGYKWYGSNRNFIHRNAPKASGCEGFFVKHSILKSFDVRILDKSVDGILGLLFRNKETDFTCVAFSCYLPPENSPWGRDAQTFYSHVLSQIYLNYGVDAIFLLGDFNSRLGNLKDVSAQFDNVTTRETIDKTHNQHGQSFSEFLNDSTFCVLNGPSGEKSNTFTSISLKGKAVVDYVCVPHDIVENCKNFEIITCNEIIESKRIQHLIGTRSRIPDHEFLIFDYVENFIIKSANVKHNVSATKKMIQI